VEYLILPEGICSRELESSALSIAQITQSFPQQFTPGMLPPYDLDVSLQMAKIWEPVCGDCRADHRMHPAQNKGNPALAANHD
jgi:hypothetical protein